MEFKIVTRAPFTTHAVRDCYVCSNLLNMIQWGRKCILWWKILLAGVTLSVSSTCALLCGNVGKSLILYCADKLCVLGSGWKGDLNALYEKLFCSVYSCMDIHMGYHQQSRNVYVCTVNSTFLSDNSARANTCGNTIISSTGISDVL